MRENSSVSVVERHGGNTSQQPTTLEPAEELREGHNFAVRGQPTHLACECLDRHVEAEVSAAGVRRHHIVVAEDHTPILPAPRQRRDSERPQSGVAETG